MAAKAAELGYDTHASAMEMANTIFGDGVTVVNASYTGAKNSSAIYSNGDNVSPDATPSDTGVILSTGNASDFTNSSSKNWFWSNSDPNQSTHTSTDTSGPDNMASFNAAAGGAQTHDASYIDADFIPSGDTMTMQFVFSSEEYPEYVNSLFNDAVGVWVNGKPVDVTVGSGDANVDNLSGMSNVNLYNDNTHDQFNTEMDGFTVTLSLKMQVVPGQVNSIRIGIADVGDSLYDSNLLIAADSVQTALIAQNDELTIAPDHDKTIDVLANDHGPGGSTLTITHINGHAVSAGDSVTLPSGQTVTLHPDGTFGVESGSDVGHSKFTYTVSDGQGHTDTGFVTVDTVPCFVSGTRIRTPGGERRVESLRPGDLVLTRDHGPQPLRWIGRRRVAAKGSMAPIRIKAGTFGRHRDLLISPQHRVLVRDRMAELLFGSPEVLIAAKHLVDGRSVTIEESAETDYVHILFDRHEVIWSEGLLSESFLPGPQTAGGFAPETLNEICALFPELDPRTGAGYGPSARCSLRGYEARLLRAARRKARRAAGRAAA
ncbi:Hint domain-containing protein [Acidimangrovimonas sediminis]|uniref:Hint domain-containing protein n=1 Tax=Acidimangrovimonas sediminis TaxID=2056283 RepID=UPI001E5A5D47|nr:Hint domain-containing protein [Acidimangrovimonas sediminis]